MHDLNGLTKSKDGYYWLLAIEHGLASQALQGEAKQRSVPMFFEVDYDDGGYDNDGGGGSKLPTLARVIKGMHIYKAFIK